MKVALIGLQLGVQYTLATTAFITAFADGLTRIGIEPRIIGLVWWDARWGPGSGNQWNAEALEPFASATPWIAPARERARDAMAAARLGILDELTWEDGTRDGGSPDWYLELLLQRELEEFAGPDGDLAIVVYPISYPILATVARIAKRTGWRVLVQSCEAMSGSWIDPNTRDDYIAAVAKDADGVWALSHYLADYWVSKGVASERVLVQPNIVREDSFAETTPAPRVSRAVYLGNLHHKEIEYLLDIAAAVKRSVPGFELRVYGDAPAERRRELADELAARGLGDTVRFEEPVPPATVPRVLSQADVLVLPRSHGEFSLAGFPNKLGEYLASGRPVVVTRVGDIPRYLTDGESAFLVEPDDCDAFAHALTTALTDPDTAEKIGAAGRKVAEELLASPVAAARIVEFIQALPARSGGQVGVGTQVQNSGRLARRLTTVAVHWMRRGLASLRHRAGRIKAKIVYAPQGYTRLTALKIGLVKVLRFLRLKPPAPRD